MIRTDLDWQSGWMAEDETLDDWLARVHPVAYGFDDLRGYRWTAQDMAAPNGRLPDGRIITERYARCPTCEQWSPCTVREKVSEALETAVTDQQRKQR